MAKRRATSGNVEVLFDPGKANPKQLEFFEATEPRICYGGAKGGGKATTNDTLICTPDGWRRMGDLRVGELVMGADGRACRILGVFPQGEIPVYRIVFADGGEIRVSGEHLWKVRVTGNPHKVNGVRITRDRWEILTTEKMIERQGKLRSNQSLVIPLCKPVEWAKRELPVKPYTLGAIIGDGNSSCKSCSITIADEEIRAGIEADGYTLTKWKDKYTYGVNGLFPILKELGLNKTCYEKRVPADYLNGCIDDRLAILQGLMDTDGYADIRGHCSYCSVCKGLAEDVQYLVRSLGGRASVSMKNRKSGISYEVNIRMPDNGITNADIFRLKRKADRCRGRLYNGGISDVTRRIVAIFPDGTAPCTCISVDNEERLYIAEGFTVTHNTWAVRVKALLGAMVGYPGIRILIMRAHYPELEENHIRPICAMVPPNMASYNSTTHIMQFENGSYIKFGHWTGEESENEYNGKEYDWIFIDEATQFTERAYNFLGGCLRGTSKIPRRMYLTCNPGGVGHFWVKRLFIDRNYVTDAENPEENENPADYRFIFATAEDNIAMVENSPGYLHSVAKMPNARAYRYGDWDAIGGNYFKDFSRKKHTHSPFRIPDTWPRYRSFDYGLTIQPL